MTDAILALYRVRGPIYYAAAAILLGNLILSPLLPHGALPRIRGFLVVAALAAGLVSAALTFLAPRLLPVQHARTVQAPVRGRWLAMNSPASKVPSHGVRAYGQAYAIDLVHEPVDAPRPGFGGEAMRACRAYPAFGQPVVAMIDGTVVAASGWRRDHRARSNWLSLIYLTIEGMLREAAGPGFVVGNHVTIRGEDGIYATVAHLQNGSLTVGVGDRVAAGDQIGTCGNSGNSTEPHVHAQLMDRASLWSAQGIPMAFEAITLDDGDAPVATSPRSALPRNGEHMWTFAPHGPA